MKKNIIVGAALALGVLSVGAISATAAGTSCCGKSAPAAASCCNSQQSAAKDATGAASALKAKEIELRQLNAQEIYDTQKAAQLESEIDGLKTGLVQRYCVRSCCRG